METLAACTPARPAAALPLAADAATRRVGRRSWLPMPAANPTSTPYTLRPNRADRVGSPSKIPVQPQQGQALENAQRTRLEPPDNAGRNKANPRPPAQIKPQPIQHSAGKQPSASIRRVSADYLHILHGTSNTLFCLSLRTDRSSSPIRMTQIPFRRDPIAHSLFDLLASETVLPACATRSIHRRPGFRTPLPVPGRNATSPNPVRTWSTAPAPTRWLAATSGIACNK